MRNWKLTLLLLCLVGVIFVSGCVEKDNGFRQAIWYHSNFVQSEFDEINFQEFYEKAEEIGYYPFITDVSTNITKEQLDSVSPLLQPDICEFNFIEITVPDSEINTGDNLSLDISYYRDYGETLSIYVTNYARSGAVSKEWISNVLNITLNLNSSQHKKVVNDLCNADGSAANSRIHPDQDPRSLIDFVNTTKYLEDHSDKTIGQFNGYGYYSSGYANKYFSNYKEVSDVFLRNVEEGEVGSIILEVDTLLIVSDLDIESDVPLTGVRPRLLINKYGYVGAFIIVHYPEDDVKEEYFATGRAELREMMENLGFSQETINSIHFGKTSVQGINITNIANLPL